MVAGIVTEDISEAQADQTSQSGTAPRGWSVRRSPQAESHSPRRDAAPVRREGVTEAAPPRPLAVPVFQAGARPQYDYGDGFATTAAATPVAAAPQQQFAGSYAWAPAGAGTITAPRSPRATERRGIAGGLVGAGLAIAKYGTVLFKVGKLGPTFISMAISLFVLAQIYGLAFGAGVLALIAVHESGHMLFAKYERLPVTAPIFLGFLGAVIGMKSPPKDARQEAVVAIGGPVVGSLGALAVYLIALAMPPGHTRLVLIAIAYFGFFVNLFNLVPVVPLDGGRVASALSVYANVAGLCIMALLIVFSTVLHLSSPFLVILLILGAFTTYKRFQTARANPAYLDAVPHRTRTLIGLAYAAMLGLTALGMGATHASLVDAKVVSVNDTSDWSNVVHNGDHDLSTAFARIDNVCSTGSDTQCRNAIADAAQTARRFQDDLGNTSVPDGATRINANLRNALAEYIAGLDTLVSALDTGNPALVDAALARIYAANGVIDRLNASADATA